MTYKASFTTEEVAILKMGLDKLMYGDGKMLEGLLPDEYPTMNGGSRSFEIEFDANQANLLGKALGELPLKFSKNLFDRLVEEISAQDNSTRPESVAPTTET